MANCGYVFLLFTIIFISWLGLLCSSLSGDLYLVIHVEEKRGIWRDGLNLYSKLDVDFTEAILGTVKKVIKALQKENWFYLSKRHNLKTIKFELIASNFIILLSVVPYICFPAPPPPPFTSPKQLPLMTLYVSGILI